MEHRTRPASDPHETDRTSPARRSRVLALRVALGVAIAGAVAVGVALLASRPADAPPLSEAVIERLAAQGVDPDLVYTVELPGYELAEQSVGVVGDEGFQAIYVSPEGHQVQLTVDRGQFSDDMCSESPIPNTDPPATPTTCQRDGAGWYRAGGDRHEYVAMRDDHLLRLNTSTGGIDRAALETAVTHAQHVTAAHSDATERPTGPVERGDLPTNGDGAPINTVGPGG